MDDLKDPAFERAVGVSNTIYVSFGTAILLYVADLFFSSETKSIIFILLGAYHLWNIIGDSQTPVLYFLSLIVIILLHWERPTSLQELYGVCSCVELCWFSIDSLVIHREGLNGLYQIILSALNVLAYCLTALAFYVLDQTLFFLFRPVQNLNPVLKAIYATVLFEIIIVVLTYPSAYRALRGRTSSGTPQKSPIGGDDEGDKYYRYTNLEKDGEIRLLRLWPGSDDSDIRCDLVHTSWDHYQTYEAISYTWASPAKTHEIAVNGSTLPVTRKVHQVLRKLRDRWQSRLLWIDSVCINQDHLEERSRQVLLMRHIYYRATKVIVWLGVAPDAKEAATIVTEIAAFMRAGNPTGKDATRKFSRQKYKAQIAALSTLFGNDWFGRMWIVQEVAVARDLRVLYGDERLRWQDLREVMTFCKGTELLELIQMTSNTSVRVCNHSGLRGSTIFDIRSEVARGINRPLSLCLESFRFFGATDPRDKVFAVIGLINAEQHHLIIPDYQKTVRDVYVDVARYIFTVEKSSQPLLALPLAGLGFPRRFQSLPSWVPDWSNPVLPGDENKIFEEQSTAPSAFNSFYTETFGNIGHLFPIHAGRFAKAYLTGDNNGYKAALGTQARFQVASDSETMAITGFHVDEVASLSSVLRYPFDAGMRISTHEIPLTLGKWLEEVEEMISAEAKTPYPTGQTREDVTWRTIIGDRDFEGSKFVRPAPDEHREGFRICKASSAGARQHAELAELDVFIELSLIMREVCFLMLHGESQIPLLWNVLTGQSGHERTWAIIRANTKYAEPGVAPPELPPLREEKALWPETLYHLTAGTDMQDVFAAFVALLEYVSQQNSAATQNIQDPARPENLLLAGRFTQATRMSYERRFCVTKDGYVGLVPPLTEVGDRICIFFGGHTPYLVRAWQTPEGAPDGRVGKYALVGECYVHGMMDGEMMCHAAGNEHLFVLE